MERYERVLRWRADGELEEARAEFWININADINKAKSCESDAKEIRREWELTYMELEGRLDSLLGGRRDLRQRPRAAERERDNARDRAELLVRKIDEAEGMAIEERDREC